MKYTPIIGLEVHVELGTKSKMFCPCPADYFGKKPNTQCCPVCLGLPGALPVPNKKAVEQTILFGLSVGCAIAPESKFDRKNYFYPDLPKGYQISQYDEPIAFNGSIKINPPAGGQISKIKDAEQKSKIIRIRRVHLEEDTGKLQHMMIAGKNVACIDFNRSGVPLMEIVSEPDFRSIDEVDQYVRKIQQIIRYLGISGADMDKGSMRIEPSISLLDIKNPSFAQSFGRAQQKSKIKDLELPEYRVEIKNINSFRFVRKALEYEIVRQTALLESGVAIDQETRGYSETKNATISQRGKEDAMDYRYFPEPDIPPMRFAQNQISKIKDQIGEMPDKKKERFIKDYSLGEQDVAQLTESKERADFFEECVRESKKLVTSKDIANYIINQKVDINTQTSSEVIAKIQATKTFISVSEEIVLKVIKSVLGVNSSAVADYKSGKTQVKMFLFGNVLKELKGEGDKKLIMELLDKILSES
jgi:aspartyl-tRNA(Asn)/glutamyl-tRNA(Gln) amidotransferase subunit B